MKHLLLFIFVVFAIPVSAEPLDFVRVENPYAYATSKVQKNGAVFMTIHYKHHYESEEDKAGSEHGPLKIINAESDVAERVELHTHVMDGDMMMMREVEHYEIPHDGSVTLEPMGHHIMLMGLKQPLKAGESFPVTLHLDDGQKRTYDVLIKNPGDVE